MERIKTSVKNDDEIIIRDLAEEKKKKSIFVPVEKSTVCAVALLLLGVFLASLFSPAVMASDDESDDGDDDGVDDDVENVNERGVHVDSESDRVEIKSQLTGSDVRDEIEVEFRVDDGIKVKMELSKYNDSVDPELEFSVEFREIIEFEDENGNGAYDSGEEEVSLYDLRDAQYSPITYITQTTVDNETEHVVSAQTADGVFSVVLHAVSNFAKIESGVLAPSEVKIDLIISNYPYEKDGSRLALMAKLEAEEEFESEDEYESDHGESGEDHLNESEDEHEEKIMVSSPDANGFFSWADTAEVDGVETPVASTVKNETEGVKIYFAYVRGTTINHDPKLGVPYQDATSATPDDPSSDTGTRLLPYLGAFLLGIIVIALAVAWRRKKNGQL